jgi:hypothetical protein
LLNKIQRKQKQERRTIHLYLTGVYICVCCSKKV